MKIRLGQQLSDRVADHRGKALRLLPTLDHRGNVVDLLRIGDRQQIAMPGLQPRRLVVMRPVEHITVTRRLQQIGRRLALRNPGAKPSRGSNAQRRQALGHLGDQATLFALAEFTLRLGIGAAMRCNFVTPIAAGLREAGTAIEYLRVQERGRLQLQPVEQVEEPPRAHAIAIVAPGVVHDVGLRLRRREFSAQAPAKVKDLVIDAQIDGDPPPLRPVIDRTIDDGTIGVAAMLGGTHRASTRAAGNGCP
ncbi:hypothetical protein NS258_14290 [Sphingomonas sanguinis]|uniref:Uncharacterized protein n=1 Tax=Sphingomonas sanguinis TaxID=33051 RepID=A0A147J639_9SPHN|nr:hypothetical protein NS258_14290 [Sphingomonas sanguinis]